MVSLDGRTKGVLALVLCFAVVLGTVAGFASDPMRMWPLLFWTASVIFVGKSVYETNLRPKNASSEAYEITPQGLFLKKGIRVTKIESSDVRRVIRPLFVGSETPEEVVLSLKDGKRIALPYSKNLATFLKKLPQDTPLEVGWTPLDRRWALAATALCLPLLGLGAAQKITFLLDALR